MENLDTDIDKYSIDDLLTILNLNEPTEYQVQDATNTIIASMRSEGNVEMADFFEEVKQKLLEEFKTTVNDFGDNEQDDEETTIGNWWQNEYPAQNNEVQADKVTNRKQRVQFFDNEYFQMNREQLGVNQDYSVPVAQGTMNPKLKNTITRLVSIDSQYRDNVLAVEGGQPSYSSPAFNSSFTVNLSESLKNVISLKLYSIELPTTWYTFDDVLGNTCFKIKADGSHGCVPPEPETEPEPEPETEPEPEPEPEPECYPFMYITSKSIPETIITQDGTLPLYAWNNAAYPIKSEGQDDRKVYFYVNYNDTLALDGPLSAAPACITWSTPPASVIDDLLTVDLSSFEDNHWTSPVYPYATYTNLYLHDIYFSNSEQGWTDQGGSGVIEGFYQQGFQMRNIGLSTQIPIQNVLNNYDIIPSLTLTFISMTDAQDVTIWFNETYIPAVKNSWGSEAIAESLLTFEISSRAIFSEPALASASEPEPEPDTIPCPTLSDCYCINPGNYDILSLTEEIVRVASPDISLNFKIEPSTNIISIRQDPKGNIIYPDASFVYYDCNGLGCVYPCIGSAYINQNLGWYLGFRRQPDESGVISIPLSMTEWVPADVPANTYGPKYCMLVLDDFNKNRLNKGIVGISDTSTKLDLPAYYSPSDISGCSKNDNCSNRVDTPIVWVSDDKPKTLTNSQLYTIQETLNNRIQPTGRITAPTTSDVLARIPLKNVTALRPEPLIETGSQLQTNEREYFGPVDIERIKVSLVDDKGYPLNLHDNDWSFSLIVEQLYQY